MFSRRQLKYPIYLLQLVSFCSNNKCRAPFTQVRLPFKSLLNNYEIPCKVVEQKWSIDRDIFQWRELYAGYVYWDELRNHKTYNEI